MLQRETTPAPLTTAQSDFERARLRLLADHGFDARSTWLTDGAGRGIYAMQAGEGGCPKLLIHGGLSEGSEWWPLAGRLDGHVVIPDRPGCGLTYVPTVDRSSFREDAARWMADVVDGVGTSQVDLIGNSMGGYTALVYALAHPERVRRLVLVGAPAGVHRQIPLFLRLWGHPLIGRLISSRPVTDPEKMRAIYGQILVQHPELLPRQALEVSVGAGTLPGVSGYSFRMLREGTDLGGIRRRLLIAPELLRVEPPTLFLWGEDDSFAPPAAIDGIWQDMPQAKMQMIPDAGHIPQIDQPETVFEAVRAFLSAG